MEDEITTIKITKTTKERLRVYRRVFGTFEDVIIELLDDFEGIIKKNK